jgi:hypothetical protein
MPAAQANSSLSKAEYLTCAGESFFEKKPKGSQAAWLALFC